MGSDLHLGPGGFSKPFLCRRDGSRAGEGASSQAHVSTEPGQGKQMALEASWPATGGKVPETTAGARGGKGPRGPAQPAIASPELRTCQGPTGPAQPAAN